MTETAKQLNYTERKFIAPKYKLSKITPKSGDDTATIITTGGNDIDFEIPVKAFNSAKSFLEFNCNIPAPGPDLNNYIHANTIPFFRRIILSTQNGTELLNILDADKYLSVVWNPETDLQKFLTFPIHETKADTLDNSPPSLIGTGSLFMRSNVQSGLTYKGNWGDDLEITDTGGDPIVITDAEGKDGEVLDPPAFLQYQPVLPGGLKIRGANIYPQVAGGSVISNTEPRYLLEGLTNAETSFHVRMPLGLIYNTILELDKTMYYGEILNLKFVLQARESVAFSGDYDDPIGNIADTFPINLFNINLQLAVEQDQGIVNQLIANFKKGFSMTVPYVNVIKNRLDGESQNITLKMNRLHGRRLKRLYHTLFEDAMTLSTSFDNANMNCSKVSKYWTLMDQVREQESDVDCERLDDYRLVEPYIEKSVVQDFRMYQYKWFHMSDYHGIVEPDKENKDNLVGGLSLDVEKTWQIFLTTVNAFYNHFTILIAEKLLTVGPNTGISIN